VIGEDGAAINAFDDDMDTFWHTEWLSANPTHPHEMQLCLGGAYEIDGFGHVPRQDGSVNGRIADYEFSPAATVLTGGRRSPPAPLPMTPASRRSNLRR